MSVISDLKAVIRESKKAQIRVSQERDRINARLIELQGERKAVLGAPLSRADLEACLTSDIAAAGREALTSDVAHLVEDARVRAGGRVEYPVDFANYSPVPSKVDGSLICALLGPEAIVAALAPALDRLDYTLAGLPLAERRARVEAIDTEINDLVAQRQELSAAMDDPEPVAKPKPGQPRLGDKMEKIGADGKTYVATWCQPTPYGSPGWAWKLKGEAEAA